MTIIGPDDATDDDDEEEAVSALDILVQPPRSGAVSFSMTTMTGDVTALVHSAQPCEGPSRVRVRVGARRVPDLSGGWLFPGLGGGLGFRVYPCRGADPYLKVPHVAAAVVKFFVFGEFFVLLVGVAAVRVCVVAVMPVAGAVSLPVVGMEDLLVTGLLHVKLPDEPAAVASSQALAAPPDDRGARGGDNEYERP